MALRDSWEKISNFQNNQYCAILIAPNSILISHEGENEIYCEARKEQQQIINV
jgi:hypothetical protein